MMNLYHKVCEEAARFTTYAYSTSFSSAVRLLHKDFRTPICNIYGFVRFADEIVDTFHDFPKEELIQEFKEDTYKAIDRGISSNPILHAFQRTVREYNIERELIEAFLQSMLMDLDIKNYSSQEDLKQYIYGSAEVVGLMCLRVFTENNASSFDKLLPMARALGSAFQKVNFLRDIQADQESLQRSYFPEVTQGTLNADSKAEIEKKISEEFELALEGISLLPMKSKFGVYVAYKYYLGLFKKIKQTSAEQIMQERIRIPNFQKAFIVLKSKMRYQLNML